MAKSKLNEIESTASRLFLEVNSDAEKIAGELFGAGPGLGARTMKRQDFLELWRKNWENPPRPEWRADELDRFAPRDPKTGARPEAGLRAWNALLRDAFPQGRAADPPPPMDAGTPEFPPPVSPPQTEAGVPDFPPPPVSGAEAPLEGTLSMQPPPSEVPPPAPL